MASPKSASTQKSSASKKTSNFFIRPMHISALKLGLAVLILGLVGIGIWQLAVYYHGKILPNIKVANVKVGGKTPVEAEKLIQNYSDQANQTPIPLSYNNQNVNPKLSEMGFSIDIKKSVNDAYNYGRTGSFWQKTKANFMMVFKSHNTDFNMPVDEQKQNDFISKTVKTDEVSPQNATLQIDEKGNINVVPEKVGHGIDRDKLKIEIINLINSHEFKKTIVLTTGDLQPKVKSSATANAVKQADEFMASAPITLTFENQNFIAEKGTVGSWLDFTAQGNQLASSVSTDKISQYLDKNVINKISIRKVDRVTMEGSGEVIEEGQDGRGVSSDELIKEIYNRVMDKKPGGNIAIKTYVITKGEKTKNPHAEAGRYPGRYIDINLSEQTLYAFDGFTLVNQFLVSTGTSSHPTPTGEYHVYGKSRVTRMDGPGYDLPGVEWVSWWSGDYSIHGTYWHNNFGHPMSHGCVNASNGDAEWVYNWDDIGTPVYVHY